ncbi:MAG: hypothetical protein CVU12_05225 [Bacteroidetes bacterium HGW-Bacteroidetes-7]|jgi:hypothetical protein|nr:MAG: hypothetical protein CVU12_05225 [Bacteroidetes bacterium HGW-Bacteroidetes-7]
MRKRTVQLMLTLVMLSLLSCRKEGNDLEVRETKFYASYNTNHFTKGESEFPLGNKVKIYCYNSGSELSLSSPLAGTPKLATAGSSGNLTPSGSIILPKGLYDFYAISLNNNLSPEIEFDSGRSQILENGKDYIWAKQTTINQGAAVSFSFSHRATGIEIKVNAGEGVEDLGLTSVRITPPKPVATSIMNLQTGIIGYTSEKNPFTTIPLNNGKYFWIILPAELFAMEVEVTVNATIGGVAVINKVYRANVPQQTFSGGILYSLNLSVNANTMSFTGSVIQDWTTQTISDIILTED